MTPAQKTTVTHDDATLELWRAAENGDLAELAAVLPAVADINARNEHGVTALMRAAQNGHVRMVRALLEHGADANIKRNDKFTALALAAFFGHTEVVRTLMEYGADSHAATRYDTSPQMWATARTFNAVVKSLEKPAPAAGSTRASAITEPTPASAIAEPSPASAIAEPTLAPVSNRAAASSRAPAANRAPVSNRAPASSRGPASPSLYASRPALAFPTASTSRPEPAPETVSETPEPRPASTVIRTLSDPPEIWDLVHEAPRNFNAGSAFVARLNAINGWAFRVTAGVVLIALCVGAVFVMRRVPAPLVKNTVQRTEAIPATIPAATAPIPVQSETGNKATETATVAPTTSENDAPIIIRKQASRSSFTNAHRAGRNAAPQVTATEVAQPAVATNEKSEPPARSTVAASEPKTTLPLSPQLITPPKSAAPKGKVIQWP